MRTTVVEGGKRVFAPDPSPHHRSLGRELAEADRWIAKAVGHRIRILRKAAGRTQLELAEPRYTKAYVSALESGTAKPSLAALVWIARQLGTPITSLLVGLDGPDLEQCRFDLACQARAWSNGYCGPHQDAAAAAGLPGAIPGLYR